MLVLSHAEGLRIYLDQLGERVHQPASDGHSPADSDILVGELFPGNLGCRIYRRTVLTHGVDLDIVRDSDPLDEIFRLAGGSAVADGDGLDGIFLNHRRDGHYRLDLLILRRMRIDDLVVEKVAVHVKAGYLAAVSESRVDRHRPLLAHRRRKQELGKIVSEDSHRLLVGLFLGLLDDLVGDGWLEQTFESIIHGLPQLICKLGAGIPVLLTEIIVDPVAAFLRIRVQTDAEKALVLGSEDGQEIVRRNLLQRHREIEIGTVLGCLGRGGSSLGGLGFYPSCPEGLTERVPDLRRFREPFGNYVPCPGECLLDRRHFPFHVLCSFSLRILEGDIPHPVGKGFQPVLPGHGGPGPALRPEREVEVLELTGNHAVLYPLAEFRSQRALGLYG